MRYGVCACIAALLCVACVLAANSSAAGQSVPFAQRVAERCKGEAAFAIAPCGCVVKNRLEGGWSEETVLLPFYAQDAQATAQEVRLVERVLNGYWPCDPRLWFMFSVCDVGRLGLEEDDALLIAERGGWRVLFYGKDALND